MIFVIKRKNSFPKGVSIEPWAVPVSLEEEEELKLVLHGVTNESEVYLECSSGELYISTDDIDRADVIINDISLIHKYGFR
ncbi:hypothetical protein [Aquirhabdus parva]|uniref:Uncharacterized protein n=1 Tax=Aquirhabdus parva TaxID=2283318 RepID=A0A345P991_9GAMM|nr:hypothetical protein [Aquirhabdus parva]AXI03850.1 hypothetical protein HYN46_14000 [Aquirhabdus parva]